MHGLTVCFCFTGHGQITLNASVDQEQVPEQALEVAINVIEGESVTFQCAAFPTLSVRPPGSSIFGSTIPPNLRALDPLTFELINISQSDNGTAFQCRGGAGFTDIGVIIVLCKLLLLQYIIGIVMTIMLSDCHVLY